MANTALTREEGWGLAISIAGHVALLAFLVLRPSSAQVVMPPERVEVTLSDDVGLTSTSPDPAPPAASVAPTVGESMPEPAVSEVEPVPAPVPEAVEQPRPQPVPKPRRTPPPAPARRPAAKSEPRPAPKPEPRSVAKPESRPQPRPSAAPKSAPPAKATARPTRETPKGGSRIGSDFLEGAASSESGSSSSQAAATIGPRVQASLSAAISRQLKPHWTPPQGADADQLVTYLAWNLNEDGSLSGTPRVLRQTGVNAANQAQAARHAEQAIRAVQLAAPFNLPDQYYAGWKKVSSFRFDIRLSQ